MSDMHAMPMSAAMGASSGVALIGMWVLMMVAMMLPTMLPTLWRYRLALARSGDGAPFRQTALVGIGYVAVWALLALAILPLRTPLAILAHTAPLAVGLMMTMAGALQLTQWKARQLECCRRGAGHDCAMFTGAHAALVRGVRLGLRCCYCCAGITAALLAFGDMSMRAMLMATAAITVERLAPGGVRTARIIGGGVVCVGLLLIERAVRAAT